MSDSLIEIKDLCVTSKGQDILHDINLVVNPGDFVSIIGPNGGGKTTLLKVILGLLSPSRGTVFIRGKAPGAHDSSIGYVPQYVNNNLSFPATVLDVVLMGLYAPGRRLQFFGSKEDKEAALRALEKMGVEQYAYRRIDALSGGERQRVLIARALVSSPELLVLDEPTASIDTRGQTDFYKLLQKLNEELTIIMVSHDLMVISSYVKSVVCLNKRMHYHQPFSSSGELLDAFYSCTVEQTCPVQMVRKLGQTSDRNRFNSSEGGKDA